MLPKEQGAWKMAQLGKYLPQTQEVWYICQACERRVPKTC